VATVDKISSSQTLREYLVAGVRPWVARLGRLSGAGGAVLGRGWRLGVASPMLQF